MLICPVCKKEFEKSLIAKKQIYCSKDCRKIIEYDCSNRCDRIKRLKDRLEKSITNFCPQCGNLFESYFYSGIKQKFCKPECKTEFHKDKKLVHLREQADLSPKLCLYCESNFVPKYNTNHLRQIYCSNFCKKEYHKKQVHLKSEAIRLSTFRNCPICEKQFTPAKSLKQTYCSKRCCYLFPKKCYGMLDRCLGQLGTDKQDHAHKILGFTSLELQSHIQSHPNWNDVKDHDWHIDHIFPIIAFIEHGIKDIKMMCCLGNLQPLKSKDNLHKNKTYDKQKFIEWLRD